MSVVNAPGFFSNGLTWPNLNISEIHPLKNDKFPSLFINGVHMSTQLFRVETGMWFSGDVFAGRSNMG